MNTTQNKRKRKSANVGTSSMHDIFENTEPTTECVLLKKGALKNFTKFIGIHLYPVPGSLFLLKFQASSLRFY